MQSFCKGPPCRCRRVDFSVYIYIYYICIGTGYTLFGLDNRELTESATPVEDPYPAGNSGCMYMICNVLNDDVNVNANVNEMMMLTTF